MENPNVKSVRYAFRLSRSTKDRLREISLALHTPLPDLLVVGAFHLFSKATSPSEYLKLKAGLLAASCEEKNQSEPPHIG